MYIQKLKRPEIKMKHHLVEDFGVPKWGVQLPYLPISYFLPLSYQLICSTDHNCSFKKRKQYWLWKLVDDTSRKYRERISGSSYRKGLPLIILRSKLVQQIMTDQWYFMKVYFTRVAGYRCVLWHTAFPAKLFIMRFDHRGSQKDSWEITAAAAAVPS